MPILLKPLILLALAAAIGWLASAESGLWVGLALAAITLLAWQTLQQLRMLHWARQMPPSGFMTPRAGGLWREIYAALDKRGRQLTDHRQQLETMLDRFRLAAEAMPEGVLILNGERAIEWMNNQAQLCLNLSLATDRGLAIALFMREPEFLAYLAQTYPSGPLVLRTQRNPGHTLQVQIVPFAGGRSVMLVRDLTHLEKLENMRRDFVANVSHELRTPLTVVAGFIESLRTSIDELPRAEVERYLTLADEQTARMRNLIQDLLTLSALETERQPTNERIEMRPLLEEIRQEAQTLGGAHHNIQVITEGAEILLGSFEEIRSAIANLTINAVRYSPPPPLGQGGRITLSWSGLADGGARLAVSDEGIGIEPQHLARLTERFYRVDRSRSRNSGGTGLGLAIVKHVLERHQARLTIQSEPGRGSQFVAIFPAARVESRVSDR